MSEEDKTYHLPTPNMDVFGEQDAAPREGPTDRPTVEHSAADQPTVGHHEGGPRGSVRFQDGGTAPRPPSLAEQRARIAAQEERATRLAEAERVNRGRRRVMIGGGVTVGIAALVGAWYLLASPQDVTARCTVSGGTDDSTVVGDNYCDPNYASSHSGYEHNGIIFIPFGGGFRQYHYYYGGTGGIGQRVSGGSFSAPSHATVRTGSGTTVQRGGFGISGRGSTGGLTGGGKGGTGGSGGGKSGGS